MRLGGKGRKAIREEGRDPTGSSRLPEEVGSEDEGCRSRSLESGPRLELPDGRSSGFEEAGRPGRRAGASESICRREGEIRVLFLLVHHHASRSAFSLGGRGGGKGEDGSSGRVRSDSGVGKERVAVARRRNLSLPGLSSVEPSRSGDVDVGGSLDLVSGVVHRDVGARVAGDLEMKGGSQREARHAENERKKTNGLLLEEFAVASFQDVNLGVVERRVGGLVERSVAVSKLLGPGEERREVRVSLCRDATPKLKSRLTCRDLAFSRTRSGRRGSASQLSGRRWCWVEGETRSRELPARP